MPIHARPSTLHPTIHQGISGKSQILFLCVFAARYLDLFTSFISLYNTTMKVNNTPTFISF